VLSGFSCEAPDRFEGTRFRFRAAAVPYTVLIRPGGEVVYKSAGTIDALARKRLIVANVADDDYLGLEAYWKAEVETAKQVRAGRRFAHLGLVDFSVIAR
jgi:hypothetical protein